jgi:hypothetical protein
LAERNVRNILPRLGSLRLDARELHHLRPLLGFCGDEVDKFVSRTRKRFAAQIGKPRLVLGVSEDGVDLPVELVDNFRRRMFSHRLLKLEHELVHWFIRRRLDREITRVLGVAPEIAFGDELESALSSMRWRVLPTEVPSPGRAE